MQPFPRLTEIRKLRQMAGWTQRKLAFAIRDAGYRLDQSQISKIENGEEAIKIDYRVALKVFEILEYEITSQSKGGRRAASEVMTPREKMVIAKPFDRIRGIANKMKRDEISQLPVFAGDDVIGTITFQDMYDANLEDQVQDHMSETLPRFPASTLVKDLHPVLRIYQAVLLERQGEVVGILSRVDAIPV